ncbi:phosphoglycerate dehydrogenase [Mesorhizobium loti]|uniref:Phosphoglycerate dehydrogenase n=1 Tax=Rhizobium loti TaxID=381 RepID=A0A117N4T4_RHILI|nr:phosphoglycerate dehydrogenase [Mesorhizobium loti]
MKVACLWHATDEELEYVRTALPAGTDVVAARGDYFSRFETSFEDVKHLVPDADIIICYTLPKGALQIAEKVKFISWLHAGINEMDLQLLKSRSIKVANIRGSNAVAVAEQTMMFMLALAKMTVMKHNLAANGQQVFPWWEDGTRAAMLDGRTLGIIGVGNIGSRVAKRAKAFNMHVLGVRRNKGVAVEHVDSMHGLEELHSVLARCDYVVLAMPLTGDTENFFGKREIEAMKPSAFLINVARGTLISEKPLYEALTSGRLRGFAADVWWWYENAMPATCYNGTMSRLGVHKLPNVLCSGDQASNADDVRERNLAYGTKNVIEFLNGQVVTNEVSLDLGY